MGLHRPHPLLPAARLLRLAAAALACGLALAACAPQAASPYRNVLLVTSDGDPASLARHSRPAVAAIEGTAGHLSRASHAAYDEAAVGLDGRPRHARVDRSDVQFVERARSVTRPPMDAVVAVAIFPETTRSEIGARVRLRADARILDVATGRRLGSVSATAEPPARAPGHCDATCLDRLKVENAGTLAAELGPAIVAILAGHPPASPGGSTGGGLVREWVLTFDNFDSREVSDAEDYLVVFSGYRSHRPAEILGRRHVIWYTSTSDPARLLRNVNRMVEELGVRARVTASGNEITLTRLPTPRGGRRAGGPSSYQW